MQDKLTVEIRADVNEGFTAVVLPYLQRLPLYRSKRHASQPGAVHDAKVWAQDSRPEAKLQFVFITEV